MAIKYPCGICSKSVKENQKALQCDICDKWIHLKCNLLNLSTYEKLKHDPNPWFCLNCTKLIFPYHELTNLKLTHVLENKNIPNKGILEYPDNFKKLLKNLNSITSTAGNCCYYDVVDFNNSLTNMSDIIFHLNISSLPSHIDDLKTLINSVKKSPLIIGISESNLYKSDSSITNVDLDGFSYIHTPTESKKGGSLLYINNSVNFKARNDLTIYKPKELESIFIEIINTKQTNLIIGSIYRHPSMSLTEFNVDYLNPLLEKMGLENKNHLLMGDFNADLIHYSDTVEISTFVDTMTSSSLFPLITQPTRVTNHSKTLIDNIFVNFHSPDITSGNLTVSISDHLVQFMTLPLEKKIREMNVKLKNAVLKISMIKILFKTFLI